MTAMKPLLSFGAIVFVALVGWYIIEMFYNVFAPIVARLPN